jgi:phosphatidylserine/phosphatidylglycerophosphate/cardiolipin synthase-like enzyme
MSQNLRLHRSQPLRRFAEALLAYKALLYRVTIVSPWVSFTDDALAATNQIVYALSDRKIPVLLITRRPTEAWHQVAVDVFQSRASAMTFLAKSLHSKLYLIEAQSIRIVFFGSPNLTDRANDTNDELVLEARSSVFDGSTLESALINEFMTYVSELRARSDTTPYERIR